jgi:hypothetical protein
MNRTPRYHLELEPVASARFRAPPLASLKGLLRTSLRAWRLKAVRVTEHPAPAKPKPLTPSSPPYCPYMARVTARRAADVRLCVFAHQLG